jgi:hypothetical protein
VLRKDVYDRVAARWTEMGLPGRAPGVLAFETATDPPKP